MVHLDSDFLRISLGVIITLVMTIDTRSLDRRWYSGIYQNVTWECMQPGPMCSSCNQVSICVLNQHENGVSSYQQLQVDTCTEDEGCSHLTARCTQSISECYGGIKFRCHNEGIFPDPYTCNVYYTCGPPPASQDPIVEYDYEMQHFCPWGTAFNAMTEKCDLTDDADVCVTGPVPHCEELLQRGALDANPNIYYCCVKVNGMGLQPKLFRCAENDTMDVESFICRSKQSSSTVFPTTLASITSTVITGATTTSTSKPTSTTTTTLKPTTTTTTTPKPTTTTTTTPKPTTTTTTTQIPTTITTTTTIQKPTTTTTTTQIPTTTTTTTTTQKPTTTTTTTPQPTTTTTTTQQPTTTTTTYQQPTTTTTTTPQATTTTTTTQQPTTTTTTTLKPTTTTTTTPQPTTTTTTTQQPTTTTTTTPQPTTTTTTTQKPTTTTTTTQQPTTTTTTTTTTTPQPTTTTTTTQKPTTTTTTTPKPTTTTTTTSKPTTPTTTTPPSTTFVVPEVCTKIGKYPDPKNCKGFYRCSFIGMKPFHDTCMLGAAYNPVTQGCDGTC